MNNRRLNQLDRLIQKNLPDIQEDTQTLRLIKQLKGILECGYLNKKEFLAICLWKSARPKKRYLENPEEEIISVTKKVFATKLENKRMELLTKLKGVSIPVASSILTLTDPQNYGVIDIRAWRTLYYYEIVKTNPSGQDFNFDQWNDYLVKLRYYAKKFKTSARAIEQVLFWHHKDNQEGNLYK